MIKGVDAGCHAPIDGTEMCEVDRGLFFTRRGWFGHLQHRSRDHHVQARGRRVEGLRSPTAQAMLVPVAASETHLAQQNITRRLVAILAADIVGYSRLMGEDEEGTLATSLREVYFRQA